MIILWLEVRDCTAGGTGSRLSRPLLSCRASLFLALHLFLTFSSFSFFFFRLFPVRMLLRAKVV